MSESMAYRRDRINQMRDFTEVALRDFPDEGNERIVAIVMRATGGKGTPNLIRELINEYRSPA